MKARSVLLLAMTMVAAWLLWTTNTARQANEELGARREDAKKAHDGLETRLREVEKSLATHRAQPAPPPAVSPAPGARRPITRPTLTDPGAHAYDDPHLLNLFIASKKAELQQQYRALFQRLSLTSAQRDAFKAAVTAQTTRGIDIAAAAHARGLPETDPDIVRLRADSDRQAEAELVPLLGAAGVAQYKEFTRTMPVRRHVDGLTIQLAAKEALRPEQAEQLVQSLANASPSYRNGGEVVPDDINWGAVDREAQSILSPVQFAAWKLEGGSSKHGLARGFAEFNRAYNAALARSGGAPSPD